MQKSACDSKRANELSRAVQIICDIDPTDALGRSVGVTGPKFNELQ